MERVFNGSAISSGISIAKVAYLNSASFAYRSIIPKPSTNPQKEFVRFRSAGLLAGKELRELYDACVRNNETAANIFLAHQMLIKDKGLESTVSDLIMNEHMGAEQAVITVRDEMVERLTSIEDDVISERAGDVIEVADRVLRILSGASESDFELKEPTIIVAEEMTASLLVSINNRNLRGIVTYRGSRLSHVAIIARSLGIPAICGIEVNPSWDGHTAAAIVDEFGEKAEFIVNPTEETRKRVDDALEELKDRNSRLGELVDTVPIYRGRKIKVNANISSASETLIALKNGANGIGLFRTEFIYLKSNDFPTEEMQFEIYKNIAQKVKDKGAIIRTMDVGADKDIPYLNLPKEDNPAIGLRGIRISLIKPDIFKTQMRAILRAACYGNLSVMYPMITSHVEIDTIHRMVNEVKEELEKDKIPYADIPEGAMIETPAAALDSLNIAKKVDFLSIGTNDLIQYTYAVDRTNNVLYKLCEQSMDTIFTLIGLTIDNAHSLGKKVSICGEMASDTRYIKNLVDMGIDELSVIPLDILKTKEIILR